LSSRSRGGSGDASLRRQVGRVSAYTLGPGAESPPRPRVAWNWLSDRWFCRAKKAARATPPTWAGPNRAVCFLASPRRAWAGRDSIPAVAAPKGRHLWLQVMQACASLRRLRRLDSAGLPAGHRC